ncbi:hypothetical protein HAX54_041217 [Datura stramonium]|uniref:Uncharacterized protein n=1 Tax=Datura stramonium TaxID=4076 RepID=A0ABS8VSR7_DATST|nr:hypothetical protein [Datura stramonium]
MTDSYLQYLSPVKRVNASITANSAEFGKSETTWSSSYDGEGGDVGGGGGGGGACKVQGVKRGVCVWGFKVAVGKNGISLIVVALGIEVVVGCKDSLSELSIEEGNGV